MESLFKPETTQKFIERINRLTPQAKAEWGKMDVAQMLTHCQKPLEIASGELVPKVSPIIKLLFGKSAKRSILRDPQFKKNIPTFAEAKIVDQRVFDTEKKKLIEYVESFQKKGPKGITKAAHPFFGPMTIEEWDALQTKHLDHHLRQFGV
ncbi:MAG: DUF1569 domain-containing protein [Bacteroidetes bacterium]|nr:DUF1569 domain-containing protein [Bacteroidota bacterium]